MYSTYIGAKRRAQALAALLKDAELTVPLHLCQRAMAVGGGYRDWDHLRRTLANDGRQTVSLETFVRPFLQALPVQAVGPARRWAEVQISRLEVGDENLESMDREWSDYYVRTHEYVFAIGVIHRTRTPLLTPGSGAGQRLRQSIIANLCLGPSQPQFDRKTYVLTFQGTLDELLPTEVGHCHFHREFGRLRQAGILEWDDRAEVLQLNPPPLELLRAHIAKCRNLDAEYWLEAI